MSSLLQPVRGVVLSPFRRDGYQVAVAQNANGDLLGAVVLRPGVTLALAYDVLALVLELGDPVKRPGVEQTPKGSRHLSLVGAAVVSEPAPDITDPTADAGRNDCADAV